MQGAEDSIKEKNQAQHKKEKMASSNSPCAACKCLRRKCTPECVFAPYFPPDNPQKFTNVHKVFGASNVTKLLNELNPAQREDAVNSLAYEAEYRLRDPVYGCVGLISILQHKLKEVHQDLDNAKKELSIYLGPQALSRMPAILNYQDVNPNFGAQGYHAMPYNMQQMMGVQPQLVIAEPQAQQQDQHLYEAHAQQLSATTVAREHEILRNLEQQQQIHQQNDLVRYNNSGFGDTPAAGFNQMESGAMQPSLALGGSYEAQSNYQNIHQQEHSNSQSLNLQHLQLQPQELFQQQQNNSLQHQHQMAQSHEQQRGKSEEERINIHPSC